MRSRQISAVLLPRYLGVLRASLLAQRSERACDLATIRCATDAVWIRLYFTRSHDISVTARLTQAERVFLYRSRVGT
jgi:hypothetical protein